MGYILHNSQTSLKLGSAIACPRVSYIHLYALVLSYCSPHFSGNLAIASKKVHPSFRNPIYTHSLTRTKN